MRSALPVSDCRRRYPDEWVVLIDYSLNNNDDVVSGHVIAHAPRKADIRSAMAEPKDAAILYTGPVISMSGVMARFDDDAF
jgi:hypothetical protein